MLLQISEVLVMSWKTKAILNYIVSAIFLALMIVHIVDEKSVLRIMLSRERHLMLAANMQKNADLTV